MTTLHTVKRNFSKEYGNLNFNLNRNDKRLGALPFDWIKGTERSNISNLTYEVDKLFQNYAVHTSDRNLGRSVFDAYNIKLKQALGTILNRDDIDVTYIGKGAFKNCQKITVGKYSYALLTFRENTKSLYGHGKLSEPCDIFYFYKNYSKGRIVKPFMTRYSYGSEYNAYMLVQYIEESDLSRKKPDALLCGKSYKYRFDSSNINTINGVIVDIGGASAKDYKLSKDLIRLLYMLKQYESHMFYLGGKEYYGEKDNKKKAQIAMSNLNADNLISELLNSGTDIYNQDNRQFLNQLNTIEQKFFLKKVRALKRFHKLKLKLQERGEYERYKSILKISYPDLLRGAKSMLIEAYGTLYYYNNTI